LATFRFSWPQEGQAAISGGYPRRTARSLSPGANVPRYDLPEFSSPVDNAPMVNKAKAGQTIPVKWYLGDEWRMGDPMFGPISDPTAIVGVTSQKIACPDLSGEAVDAIETYVSDPGTLQYLGDGYWQFNWRTQRLWTGECRTMTLTLSDGTTKSASFSFR
jgi:hypothetical protein